MRPAHAASVEKARGCPRILTQVCFESAVPADGSQAVRDPLNILSELAVGTWPKLKRYILGASP